MNSEPLSLSRLRKGTGSRPRISCALTRTWPFPQIGSHSTQPVAISTAQTVCRKKPSPRWPQCATRSTSRNLGWASFHSAKVRIGICCLSQLPGWVVARPRRATVRRAGASSRSSGAVLILPKKPGGGGRHGEFATARQPLEELADEGLQALGANLAGRLPQHRGGGRDARPIAARPPHRPPAAGRRAARPQRPDDGFPMVARDRTDLIEQPPPLGARRRHVSPALPSQILPHTPTRHGHPLGLGNRTSAISPFPPVTIILRRRDT